MFVVGKIVEPESREITQKDKKKREIVSFGILSGRVCHNFEIWDGDKMFDKVSDFEDGDLVIAIVNATVNNEGKVGKLQYYLNGIGECPEGLREQLMSFTKAKKE